MQFPSASGKSMSARWENCLDQQGGRNQPKRFMVAWFFLSCLEIRVALGCSKVIRPPEGDLVSSGNLVSHILHKPCLQGGQQKLQ